MKYIYVNTVTVTVTVTIITIKIMAYTVQQYFHSSSGSSSSGIQRSYMYIRHNNSDHQRRENSTILFKKCCEFLKKSH